jgi:uncharacterized membrane protein
MKTQSFLVLLIIAIIGAFAALNWEAFNVPTALSIGFADITMPIGLVMLGLTTILTILFLTFVLTLQGSTLLMTRRQSKELQAKRALADEAEASRFTELRQYLELEFKQHVTQNIDLNTKTHDRLDRLEAFTKSLRDHPDNV